MYVLYREYGRISVWLRLPGSMAVYLRSETTSDYNPKKII